MNNDKRGNSRRLYALIAFGIILNALVMNLNKLGSLLTWLISLTAPILLALACALILDVPMHGFERLLTRIDKKKHLSPRASDIISLILTLISVPLVIGVMMRFIIPQFVDAITKVIEIINTNRKTIEDFVARLHLDPAIVTQKLDELMQWIRTNINHIAGATLGAAMSIFSSITTLLLAIILSIYLLLDKRALRRRTAKVAYAYLPESRAALLCRVSDMFVTTFRVFLSRQCLEAVILGLLTLICMLIFSIPYAITICCMTAVLALLPYIGAYLSLFIGCILIITVSPMKALLFAIIFLVTQQIEGNIIYPRVVGSSVGLPAYITLAAVMLGSAIAGIAGMFFIIPVVSVLYVLFRESVDKRTKHR